MAAEARERAMENLAVASAIGFMAIIVAAASLFADSASAAAERSAIAALGGGVVREDPPRFADPAFSRIHRVSDGAAPYGAVLSLPTKQGALRAALLFRKDGTVSAASALGPRPSPAWLRLLVGTGSSSPAPTSRLESSAADAVSGATESFLSWADAARRAASAVSAIEGGGR